MPETNENNNVAGDGPPDFKTHQPVVGSSKPPTDKGKGATETPQPNIFEALQHMLSPEQLKSAAEVFQAMASQTLPAGCGSKRPPNRPHSPVKKMRYFASGRQGDQSRHDPDQGENSKTPTELMGEGDEEDHQDTEIKKSSQPNRERVNMPDDEHRYLSETLLS